MESTGESVEVIVESVEVIVESVEVIKGMYGGFRKESVNVCL